MDAKDGVFRERAAWYVGSAMNTRSPPRQPSQHLTFCFHLGLGFLLFSLQRTTLAPFGAYSFTLLFAVAT